MNSNSGPFKSLGWAAFRARARAEESAIFQPFHRVENARDRQTGGIGLRLAIVARSVQLHGGATRAANESDGGLRVKIRLPAAPA